MQRFVLMRDLDETGISGTGKVAEGVEFSDGRVVLHWVAHDEPHLRSVSYFDNIEGVEAIHGHNGKTRIVWQLVTPEVYDALVACDAVLSLLHHRGIVDSEYNREDIAAALKKVQRFTR